MNLDALQTFVAIVEEGSLVNAARRLHVSQSTVTTRLKTLEAELGHQLINRSKSGATPTAVGHRLRRNAETIVQLWSQTQRDASLPDAVVDVADVACECDLWTGLAVPLIAAMRDRAPTLAISARPGSASEVADRLSQGRADIAFTYAQPSTADVEVQVVGADTLVLVANSPGAAVRFNPSYFFVDGGDNFERWHTATYADAGIARCSFSSATFGLGYLLDCQEPGASAYLPRRMVAEHLAAGRLHALDEAPTFERDVYVAMNVGATERWPWLAQLLAELLDGSV